MQVQESISGKKALSRGRSDNFEKFEDDDKEGHHSEFHCHGCGY